jgi:tetratricopeptide (TPR) repeat protein
MNVRSLSRAGILFALVAVFAISQLPTVAFAQQPTEEKIADYRKVIQSRAPEELLEKYEEFVKKYPESIIIPNLLQRVITAAAEIDPESPRVLEYAEQFLKAAGDAPMNYNNVAWWLFEARSHLDKAAEWADIAIQGFPADDTSRAGKTNRAMVLDTVANIAYARGDTERGIQLETEAMELNPASSDYRGVLGGFLLETGRSEEAERYIVECLLQNPRDARGLDLLDELAAGMASGGQTADDVKEALIETGVDRMLAEATDADRVRRNLALVLAELGLQTERALGFARAGAAQNPNDMALRSVLGDLLVKAEQWEEAEPHVVAVLLHRPTDRRARTAFNSLATRHVNAGEDRDAYREAAVARGIERFLAEAEDEMEAKQTMAASLESMNLHLDRARSFAREAVSGTGPESGGAKFLASRVTLAAIELKLENYEEVLSILKPAARLAAPYEYRYHLTRGKALEELGRAEEAIEAYLASAVMVSYPPIMQQLTALWEKTYGEEKNLDDTRARLREELEAWHPAEAFAPPADWSGRVVLAELFTGSECPPCVASDMAYDYLLEYYPERVLAVLEYHLHIPGPDPMTNPDAEARQAYYNAEERIISGTPTSIVNGTDSATGGGGASAARARFDFYSWSIENGMGGPRQVLIDLSGSRTGRSVSVQAEARVSPMSRPEGDLRLRIALAERVVHHEGGNGVAEHKMVVRKLIGGNDGFAFDHARGTVAYSGEVDLTGLEADLLSYLTDWETENSSRFGSEGGFEVKRHEIDETKLVLVAFVQDETTRKILQAKVFGLR